MFLDGNRSRVAQDGRSGLAFQAGIDDRVINVMSQIITFMKRSIPGRERLPAIPSVGCEFQSM